MAYNPVQIQWVTDYYFSNLTLGGSHTTIRGNLPQSLT